MKFIRSIVVVLLTGCQALVAYASSPYLIRHFSTEDGLSQSTVSCIMQDSQGYMWFGTWDGLNRFDGDRFVHYRSDSRDSLADHNNRIDAIWETDGRIYVKNYENLIYTIDNNVLLPVHDTVYPPAPHYDSIYVDRHGIIWTVDDEPGISRYRDGAWKRFCPPTDPRYDGQLHRNFLMLEDKSGQLWVNPTGGGFSRYDYENDRLEWPFAGLTNMIHTAYIDNQGLLWLSTYNQGIDCINLNTQPFEVVDLRTESDPIGEVRAIHVEGDQVTFYQRDKQQIYCTAQTGRGLLLGTKGKGVIGLPYHPQYADVYSIAEGDNGSLYIGTYGGGIVELTPDNDMRIHGNGLKVREVMFTHSKLYAATTSGLLVGDSLLPYYDIRCLLEDSKGRIWFGTFGGGLHRLQADGNGFRLIPQYTNTDIVLAMAEDANGDIWFTDETGITCFKPESQAYQHYAVLNGEYGAFFNEAKAQRIGEDLLFGYNHGYCRFNPKDIHHTDFVPPLVIGDIEYRNRQSVNITFAALDYANPTKILYSWKLSGIDDDWTIGSTERIASYNNLKSGKYIFQVRSTNSEGIWVDNMQQITITVQPSLWQSWWVVLLILILLLVIGWLVWNYLRSTASLRQEVEVEQKVTDIKLRFFTNISHELRTPLTLISGPVDNILTNEKLSPSVREQLEIVSGNARRMLRMINMLLDFRKMQHNQLKLKVRPVHFWALIEEASGNFIKEAQKKNITFEKKLLTKDDLVWVDRDKMDTVFFNLLGNAFKYTPNGGTITVQLAEKPDFLLLSVSDTGVGIPKDKRAVLFERFQSNNELNGNTAMGTGIGLNLSKELVDMHQGYIEVESEVGKGSTFTVLIRRGNEHYGTEVDIVVDDTIQADINAVQPLHNWSVRESLPKMLIVDDNEDMRLFISSIFAEHFTIATAEDGLMALESIRKDMPAIVITDWMMPNMDGLELLHRLRENKQTEALPIILLTAKTTIESQLEGLQHGADDYITKPFSPAFIKTRVQNLLQQREKLQEHYRDQIISMDTHKQEKTPDDIFLARLMAYMDQQMDNNNLTVDDMVEYMGVGRTVFFNRLKSLTQLSPVEFIREVRIKRAVQLLEMNSYNITEISYMVGMSDSRYFSKCFKQLMGVTPSEYKKQHVTNKD
ncbi:MAG: response regulator [Paludibacteraceae bacterium]|nr:response regulator [Paludibacteraceae bacterium]